MTIFHEHLHEIQNQCGFTGHRKLKGVQKAREAEDEGASATSDNRSVLREWPLEAVNGANGHEDRRDDRLNDDVNEEESQSQQPHRLSPVVVQQ